MNKFKYINHLFFLSAFAITVTACKKDDDPLFDNITCSSNCYIVEGQITEGQTGDGLPNITLNISHYHSQNQKDLLFVITSNEEGRYSTATPKTYFRSNWHNLDFHTSTEGFVNGGFLGTFNIDTTKVDDPQVFDIVLYKATTLRVLLKNPNNIDFGSISVHCKFNLENVSNVGIVAHYGPVFQEIQEYRVPCDLPTLLTWRTYGNGHTAEGDIEITVPCGELMTFEIII